MIKLYWVLYMPLQVLVQLYIELRQQIQSDDESTHGVIHFVETSPSVLRELSWLRLHEMKVGYLLYVGA